MEKILHEIWYDPKTGFTSGKTLLARAQLQNPAITKKQVDTWLAKQRTAQLHKPARTSKSPGHIVANAPNSRWRSDLVDMQRYPSLLNRKKMHWILVAVDVFTRKLYARAMQTKEVTNVVDSFNDILKEAGQAPQLDTDQGSYFAKTFDKGIPDEINHKRTFIGDHRALGVVDATIRIFKTMLFRAMTANNDPTSTGYYSWAKNLKELAENFNDMPREALLDKSPNEVEEDEVLQGIIGSYNLEKRQQNNKNKKSVAPYKVGDKVRVPAQTGKFKRGFKKQMTDKEYPITKVNPNSVEVDVNGTKKRYLFSEVGDAGIPLDKDVFEVKEVTDQTRDIKRGKKSVKQFWVKFSDGDEQWIDEGDLIM
eukprot:Lithocolla_globosa_v1_NODE_16_length_10446_cov_10.815802.p3 type:complete len:366 gc:universal NODE_16_length_10446_cov_10.815802:8583-7486(-)